MRKTMWVLLLVLIFGSVVLNCSIASSIKLKTYRLPQKLSQLTDLRPVLRRKDLSSAQKTEVILLWLKEERRHPSLTTKGLGGGDVNSSYIQAQLIKAFAEVGDPQVLRKLESNMKADINIRDAACLALGLMGDSMQVSKLIGILKNQSEPYFRVTAAEALGSLGAAEAIPALKRALKDKYTAIRGGCLKPSGPSTIYPVREAAQGALRVLNSTDPNLKTYMKKQIAHFKLRLAAASKKH